MAGLESITKHLICSLCLHTFKVPKTLPCLHTFCESCLQRHINSDEATTTESINTFLCPVCRNSTSPVDGKTDKLEWARGLSTNQFISVCSGQLMTETPQHCFPCSLDNKQSLSCCLCITCDEYLCKSCQRDHQKFKPTRTHAVIAETEYPIDGSILHNLSKLQFCSCNNAKKVEFKCISHEVFLCCICATTSHKSCENIVTVETEHFDEELVYQKYLKELALLKKGMEDSLNHRIDEADHLEYILFRIERQTLELITQLKAIINHIENEFMQQLEQTIKLEKKTNSVCIAECVGIIDFINRSHDAAALTQKYGSISQKLAFRKRFNDDMEKIRSSLQLQKGANFDDISGIIRNEIKLLWSLLQKTTNSGLDQLSALKSISDKQTVNVSGQKCRNTSPCAEKSSIDVTEIKDKGKNISDKSFAQDKSTSHKNLKDRPNVTSDAYKTSSTKQSANTSLLTEGSSTTSSINEVNENEMSTAILSRNTDHQTTSAKSFEMGSISDGEGNDETGNSLAKCTENPLVDPVFKKSTSQTSLMHCPLEKWSEFDISVPGEVLKLGCHVGVVCLENGDMVFLDKSNKTIKMITSTFQYRCHAVLQESPLDITLVENDTIGVAVKKAIILFKISENEIQRKSTFPTSDKIFSLCCTDNDFALLATDGPQTESETYIHFRSKQNRIIKDVDKLRERAGKTVKLGKTNLVRLKSNTELVIGKPDQVIVFEKSGMIRSQIDTGYLKNVDYISFDMQENMYLCDAQSGVVHLISGECDRVSRLLISGITKPASVAYNQVTESVVVGFLDNNNVHVYRFKAVSGISK